MIVTILGLLAMTAGAVVSVALLMKPDKLTAKKWDKFDHKPTNDD